MIYIWPTVYGRYNVISWKNHSNSLIYTDLLYEVYGHYNVISWKIHYNSLIYIDLNGHYNLISWINRRHSLIYIFLSGQYTLISWMHPRTNRRRGGSSHAFNGGVLRSPVGLPGVLRVPAAAPRRHGWWVFIPYS